MRINTTQSAQKIALFAINRTTTRIVLPFTDKTKFRNFRTQPQVICVHKI